MLIDLLPDDVVAVEAYADDQGAVVYPGEEAYIIAPASPRGREFVTARRCAREALGLLGVAPGPISVGPKREPVWPAGVVGTITHCEGYRGAAVSRAVASVGVDAEPDQPLPPGVLDQVASPEEQRALDALARSHPGLHWDRLLFTAKEAVYKAWFPLTGAWLDFEDAVLAIDAAAGTFRAELLRPGRRLDGSALDAFDGRFLTGRGLLLSAVVVR